MRMSDEILDYYDYPPREPCEWTMHYHIRGPKILLGEEEGFYIKHPKGNFYITPEGKLKKVKKIPPNAPKHSSHIDFRIDYGDYLIGWTLVTGNTGDDMLKIIEVSDKKKMLCLKKEPEPKAWLHITSKKRPIYIAPRGSVGATKYTEGAFIHLDDGILWPGTLKPSFVEYFLEGDLLKGRYVIRQTALNIIDPETGKKSTQKWPAFLFWKPRDQIPYICKKRARKKKYVPPKGEVPIAPRHIDEIPEKVYDALLYLLEVWSE